MSEYSMKTKDELEQLIAQKDMEAACELAKRFLYGQNDAEKNPTRAYQLLHRAEKRQHKEAFLLLGQMYENGIYFVKNPQLAKEYYEKAGVEASKKISESVPQSVVEPTMKSRSVSLSGLLSMYQQAEKARSQGQTTEAKSILAEILREIAVKRSSYMTQQQKDNLDRLEVDTNWLLGYTNYNENNFTEAMKYFDVVGVAALHPWSIYLRSTIHQMQNVPRNVMEADLKMLKEVENNQNLSMQEKGDILAMIADIHSSGIADQEGAAKDCAMYYYLEAASYGNTYATKMAQKL